MTRKFYCAARFSQIFVADGYPIPGNGSLNTFYYDPFGPQADNLWRATVGVGYRFSPQLIWKLDYSFERGQHIDGTTRQHVDLLATEVAFAF